MCDLRNRYTLLKSELNKSSKFLDIPGLSKLLNDLGEAIENTLNHRDSLIKEIDSNSQNDIDYQLLFRNSPTAIALTNRNGQILQCNQALLKLLGYNSEDELKQRSSAETYISASEREDVFYFLDKSGGSVEKEIQIKKKNGEIIDVLLSSRYLKSSGNNILVDNLLDISLRKKALRKLSENQNYLNTIFNSINSGVYLVNPATKEILEINDFALLLLKYRREEVLGKKCFNFICDADKFDCSGENSQHCMAIRERQLITSEGVRIDVLNSVQEIELQGTRYLLETFTDISTLKIQKEQIAEREKILQATLEATGDGIIVMDEQGTIINSNQRFFEMWQINSDEYLQMKPTEAAKKLYKELLNPVGSYINIERAVDSNKKFIDFLYFSDGRVFEQYTAPIYKAGDQIGRIWRFKDVTQQAMAESKLKELNEELENKINERTVELRISETRLKEAQEIAHLGHWLLDLNTYLIKGSENVYQLLGFEDSKEEKRLDEFLAIVHPDDVENLKEAYLFSLKTKQPFNTVHRIIGVDGKILYLRQKCRTFYNNKGKGIYSLGISQDITQQKLASIALMEHERQLEMAMEGTGLGLWDWNMLTNMIYINSKFIEVIGYDGIIQEKAIGFDFLISLLHADDFDRILTSFLRYTQSGSETYEEEFRLKRSNGEYIWVHARSKVFEWAKDKPSRSIGTFFDVTERRKDQLKLKKSEEKFRKLTQFSPSPISIQSLDKVLFVNEAWCNALGYTEKQALKLSFIDLVHPDDKKLAGRYAKLWLFGNAAPRRYEIKLLTTQKITKWFDISVTVIDYEEKKASLAVLNDITRIKEAENALRESEEKFKSLFFGNNSVMLLLDVENEKIVDANQAACDFYQYSLTDLKSIHLSEITLHSVKELKKSLKYAILGKQNLFVSKHKISTGSIYDVEVYSGKVKYGGKDVVYAIIHDITDRKIAEENMRKSQKELKKLNLQKDKFFSIISHDLKGPIGNFMSFADLLKNHKELLTNESAESLIDHSYNLAQNTYKLLENLLLWSKSQLGGIKLIKQKLQIVNLFSETINLVKESALSKNI
ncbi:MAG: PAS domain S-box protein, partial [Bacteroidales bacterium]|nr:PAS domain S-box protein [Bacteroidales bacterium]